MPGSRSPKSVTTISWPATSRADRCDPRFREREPRGTYAPGFLLAREELRLLLRRTEIERRQFDLRHLDLDLVKIDADRLVEQCGHRDREGDHQRDHQRLQPDPGHRTPIDVRALDLLGRDATQIEECKTEWRVQERSLHVDAEH